MSELETKLDLEYKIKLLKFVILLFDLDLVNNENHMDSVTYSIKYILKHIIKDFEMKILEFDKQDSKRQKMVY